MEEHFDKEVRPYLDLIDSLRHVGVHQDVSLPQIAVMGDQSSGKSSVLHSLSGIPFPKGSGLVTRCPTQLIMSKSAPGTPWTASASINFTNGGDSSSSSEHRQPPGAGPIASMDQVTGVIEQFTNFLTKGKSSNFSTDSIVIKVTSPDSPDLTIIDLPGIVRTTTQGQDATVITQVNALIDKYMSQPNTIILAVVPANQDIATVDILERAAKVDPQGHRTLGVLTKPDLIGEGGEEEVLQVLCNIRKPLRLGYVMVKNQSVKESNTPGGMSWLDARAAETTYFRTHPHYSLLPTNCWGSVTLTVTLTKLLVSCIKTALPGLKWEIESLLEQTAAELEQLGATTPSEERERQSLVMDKVSEYCRIFRCSSRGDYKDTVLTRQPHTRLHACLQRIYRTMQEDIASLRPQGIANAEAIRKLSGEMQAQRGREMPGFLSSQVFYSQLVEHVELWRPVVEICQQQVVLQTHRVVAELAHSISPEFPLLANAIKTLAAEVVDTHAPDISDKLEALLAREQDPFTAQDILLEVVNGIRFRAFDKALIEILDKCGETKGATTSSSSSSSSSQSQHDYSSSSSSSSSLTLREEVKKKLGSWYQQRHGVNENGNVQEMVSLIQAYWDVASRRLIDNVCMAIEMEFTSKVVKQVEAQCFMYSVSLDKSIIEKVLVEDPIVKDRRAQLLAKRDRLVVGLTSLRKVAPEISSRPPT